MRLLPIAVAALFAFTLVVPTAAAGCGCDPNIVVLLVELMATCTLADAHYLVDGSAACWGITPAVKTFAECRVADAKALAGQGAPC